MMEKHCLFHLKGSFHSEDIKIFVLTFFGNVGKWLDKKAKINFKIYGLTFGQLIEYNVRNNFLENSYRKCYGETSPTPFSKKSKLSISLTPRSTV